MFKIGDRVRSDGKIGPIVEGIIEGMFDAKIYKVSCMLLYNIDISTKWNIYTDLLNKSVYLIKFDKPTIVYFKEECEQEFFTEVSVLPEDSLCLI